jgi:predicted PurR-regulated permease PerM
VEIRAISARAALTAAAVVLGVLIVLRFLWIAHAVFIVAFLGILIGLALSRAADHLERFRIPRAVSAAGVLLICLGALSGLGIYLAPVVGEQTRDLSRELPKAIDKIESLLQRAPVPILETVAPEGDAPSDAPGSQTTADPASPSEEPTPHDDSTSQKTLAPGSAEGGPQNGQPAGEDAKVTASAEGEGGLKGQLGKELRGATRFLFPLLTSTFAAIGGLILVLFIALYIAINPELYRKGMLHLIPHDARPRAEELTSTLGATLRQWLIARLIAMVVIGVITGVGLALLQVRGAVALGVLAGLLEFVPFFGPIAAAIPAIGIALVDSPEKALWVTILYLLIQQLEGNVVTPLLLKSRLDIPPVLTVLTVAALGVVFGVIGMLIAEPLLAVALVVTKMLYVQDVVGDKVKIGKKE